MKSLFRVVFVFFAFISIANYVYSQGSTDVSKQPRVTKGQEKGKKGKYTEWGMHYQHPYTTFANANEMTDPEYASLINTIKTRATTIGSPFRDVYITVCSLATDPVTTNFNEFNQEINLRARAAKYAAFVFLLGVDESGASLSGPDRDAVRNLAIEYLLTCNYECPADDGKYAYRTKDLIMYLQAYDLLMSAPRLGLSVNQGDMTKIKYRLQRAAKNLYTKGHWPLGTLYRENNHTLMGAAALGVASIVLNDCKNYALEGDWHPDKWAREANGRIIRTLYDCRDQMSSVDGTAGYAEGPHYFVYAFENLSVFFRAYDNAVTAREHSREYNIPGLNGSFVAKNYLFDDRIYNIYHWYVQNLFPNGENPWFDATNFTREFPYFLTIYGRQELVRYKPSANKNLFVEVDYIVAGIERTISQEPACVALGESGETILRTPYDQLTEPEVYLRVAAEKAEANNGGHHEYPDASSFMVYAGYAKESGNNEIGELLAFHPGYPGYDWRKDFDNDDQTNLITVDRRWIWDISETGPAKKVEGYTAPLMQPPNGTWVRSLVKTYYKQTDFERHITMHSDKTPYLPYYVIKDVVDRDALWSDREYTWNLNGNGNYFEGTCSTELNGQRVLWYHPCTARGTFGLMAYVRVTDGDGTVLNADYDLHHEYDDDERPTLHNNRLVSYHSSSPPTGRICNVQSGSYSYGIHARMRATMHLENDSKMQFYAIVWPYECSVGPPPVDTVQTVDGRGGFRIKLWGGDSLIHVHQIGNQGDAQMLINPFQQDSLVPTVQHNSDDIFMAWSRNATKKFENCIAVTHFRTAVLSNGTYLRHTNTGDLLQDTLIAASGIVDVGYELTGKYKYQGVLKNEGPGPTMVMFYLPDLQAGIDMKAVYGDEDKQMDFVYDDSTKKIRITFPIGMTTFEIKPVDACLFSCFFPEEIVTIDTLFDFKTGTLEVLGHDLDIVKTEGHLQITNGSKMSICEDFMLVNKDSITMLGLWDDGDAELPLHTIYDESGDPVTTTGQLKVTDRLGTKKSMIIVNNEAGLVLETGSYTHVGANSTILVRKGGTLLIQKNAVLEIGSRNSPGWGEVIIEEGAFLCVDDSAIVRFYADSTDSTDKNIFYISVGGDDPATAGTNQTGCRDAFKAPLGEYSSHSCVAFCYIKSLNIHNSIYNRKYGWSNINLPEINVEMKDTFCYGEPIELNATGTLNETDFYFELCAFNTLTQSCTSATQYTPSSAQFGSWDTGRAGYEELHFSPGFTQGTHYRLRMVVKNHCNEYDTLVKVFLVAPLPDANFTVPDTACPGFETITANGSASVYGSTHTWTISRSLSYSQVHSEDEEFDPHEASYEGGWSPSSSFDFDNYRVYGNSSYAINLEVSSICGTNETWDTVHVPLSAKIGYVDSTYQTTASIGLQNLGTNFTAWKWSYENVRDSLNMNKLDQLDSTTQYILRTSSLLCVDYDSVTIKLNLFAHAGPDWVICAGDTITLGEPGILPPIYRVSWEPDVEIEIDTVLNPEVHPSEPIIYTMYIIHRISNDTLEMDEVTVIVDTVPEVGYTILPLDTQYYSFTNATVPYTESTSYLWVFSDGPDSSTETNTYHEFPMLNVDTFYRACLYATNYCGTYAFCDTFWVDSMNMSAPVPDSIDAEFTISSLVISDGSGNASRIISAYPNPFTNNMNVLVSVVSEAKEATLQITDPLGRNIKSVPLPTGDSKVNLNLDHLKKGVYLCTLIVDGEIIGSLRIVKN